MVSEAKSDHTIDFFMATALTPVARDILAIGASTISFDKITRIYSAQEGHKATDMAGATFADVLDELLSANPEGVDEDKLQRILNEKWGRLQREKNMKGWYECQVKPATCSHIQKFP